MSHHRLEVVHVSRLFGSGHTLVQALEDVTFTVEAGEVVLVMGPSGSGKTTLLTIIGGLLRPSTGHVLIDGDDIVAMSARERTRLRRCLIGFVYQTFNLLEALTAQENVEIALNIAGVKGREAATRARRLLIEVGLEQRTTFRAGDLSSGEKQRVALARALANRPALLLADEPTANLDARHRSDVVRLLRSLSTERKAGVVIVSHDPRLTRIADRCLTLQDGHLETVETGSPAGRVMENMSIGRDREA